jgi:hypothetical protein
VVTDVHNELDHDGDPGEREVPVEEVKLLTLSICEVDGREAYVVATGADYTTFGVVLP